MSKNFINKNILGISIGILAAYGLVRSLIYYLMPTSNLYDWFIRDSLMTIPRGFFLFCFWYLNKCYWRISFFQVSLKGFWTACLHGILLTAIYRIISGRFIGDHWPLLIGFSAIFTSFIVGLFEEYSFRGIILDSLLKVSSSHVAILISSSLFTFFHIQAQPMRLWPSIFLTGLVFALLRINGLSLWWLAVMHGIIDSAEFFAGTEIPPDINKYRYIQIGLLLIYAIVMWILDSVRKKPLLASVELREIGS